MRESILVKILISHLTALIKNHWWAFGFEEVFRKFIEGEILEKQGWRVFFVSRKIPQLTVDYLMDQIANAEEKEGEQRIIFPSTSKIKGEKI